MESFLAQHAASELWALSWHFGIVGFVLICGILWAIWGPIERKAGIWVAVGAGIIFVTAGIYTKLGADYVQAKWDAANAAQVTKAKKARSDAEITYPTTTGPRAPKLPNDPWNRDK